MRIAIIDDLERDARQLADQVSTYMSTHRIPADTPEIFRWRRISCRVYTWRL